jgi:DNA primase
MARYTTDSIERVRDAVDMVALVGAKTDLRRVGSRWVGLCPFHDERTPSFSVNAEQKLYFCFGCEAKGDAIRFVEQTEALDFPGAVELLAERHGMELRREHEDPRAEERRRRRERLLSLLERTARFYATYLWESAEAAGAREYLADRGLHEEVLRDFRVGYAPSAWDRVLVAAQRDGASPEELVAAGLAQRGRGGGLYDRFRARIMFPLADARGRVLGFGARALHDGQQPKYLNTSENEVYHKGRQLFGIDRARPQAARLRRVVVVEGYTDVLALHQAGVSESVGIMGTALTQEQLTELGRAVGDGVVYLALDADRSGQEAMLRAARGARDQEIELRVVEMPEGTDPADLVAQAGAQDFTSRLDGAFTVLEFQVRRVLADGNLETTGGRDRALEEVRPLIAATPERSATRDELVRLVSDRLDVPVTYVTDQAARPAPVYAPQAAPRRRLGAREAAEREFLAMCARSGQLGHEYLERVADHHLSSDPARQARRHLTDHFEDPLAGLSEDEPALAELVTRIVMEAGEEGPAPEPILRMSFLQLEQRWIEREIRRAAEGGELERQDELAEAKQEIRREFDALMGQTV